MARAARAVSEAERRDWAAYALTVRPLPGQAPLTAVEAPAAATPTRPAHPPAPRATSALPPALAIGSQPGGLDNASWNRFRGGRFAPQRTLDLHGRTAQRAFHALHAFLHAAQADRVRCVEVITGRGQGENGGILRRELPMWLNLPALRPLVLAASHPHPANAGSVRLLLRRPR
jgi:DNA-nicking Smr family endonuclease